MPKYDYKCDECDETVEFQHPMAETMDFHDCINPVCPGLYHKVFTPTPSHFKGKGWGKVYGVHKPKTIS